MDSETFEEVACGDTVVGNHVDCLTEGSEVTLVYVNGKVVEVIVPSPANYEIAMMDPNIKGNRSKATGSPQRFRETQPSMFPDSLRRVRC
jgi:hypothetical protein